MESHFEPATFLSRRDDGEDTEWESYHIVWRHLHVVHYDPCSAVKNSK